MAAAARCGRFRAFLASPSAALSTTERRGGPRAICPGWPPRRKIRVNSAGCNAPRNARRAGNIAASARRLRSRYAEDGLAAEAAASERRDHGCERGPVMRPADRGRDRLAGEHLGEDREVSREGGRRFCGEMKQRLDARILGAAEIGEADWRRLARGVAVDDDG